jgi:hypothetical protein
MQRQFPRFAAWTIAIDVLDDASRSFEANACCVEVFPASAAAAAFASGLEPTHPCRW